MNEESGAAGIETEFRNWHVWMSDTGRWWAARKTNLTAAESSTGCAQYLDADSPQDLSDQIAAEEALSARLGSPDHRTRPQDTWRPDPEAGHDKPTRRPGTAEGPQ